MSWRLKIFKKDDFTCQLCYKLGCYLEAHHIKKWEEYPDLRYEISNGITLCKNCHNNTKGKEKLFEIFLHEVNIEILNRNNN